MGKKRKTSITIETERVIWLRKYRGLTLAWCPDCGEQTRMLSTDEAALQYHVSMRAIYRLVDAHRIHFTETPDESLLICPKSLWDFTPIEGG